MSKVLRIGTRDSELAVWQATQVQNLLQKNGAKSELVFIKSEGDKDLVTPLYALGVQGIFTKTLDTALLNNKIDIAVHSMKDVPVQLAEGLQQAAVLKRGNWKDILVKRQTSNVKSENDKDKFTIHDSRFTIATSSVRRIAQWLHRYPNSVIENLRGNVNTRLRKLKESNWYGAIFAAAGLERINLRPANSIDLDWMLPAPTQGAIMVVCRTNDEKAFNVCSIFNDEATAICTKIEKDFLKELMGGCSTPIAALAEIENDKIIFKGNILSVDGKQKVEVNKIISINNANNLGKIAAWELLNNGGEKLLKVFAMQKFKASILSTRAIDDILIKEAKSKHILIDVLSFIKTEPIDSIDIYEEIENALLEIATVVFTSMNAVEAVAAHLNDYIPDWKIYCIGSTTKKLVQEYFGEDLIAETASDATELAEKIIEDNITDEVIFFCGDKRRDELPSILNEHNINVNEIEVYQTNIIQHTIEKNYDGILFFSPSAVQSFFSTNKLNDKTILFAIGNTTSSALKKYSKNKIIVADEPDKNNLVEKAIEYFS